ncbi:MAG TPA: hypothetical protein VIV82_02340 [Verrucomicrobiae bacterium]
MSDRELVLAAVQEMPKTASLREIADELLVLAEVRERMEKNPEGRGVSAEEVLRQVSSWVTK